MTTYREELEETLLGYEMQSSGHREGVYKRGLTSQALFAAANRSDEVKQTHGPGLTRQHQLLPPATEAAMLRVPSSSRAVVAAGTRSCRAFATSSARRAVERNLPLSEDAEDADGDGDAGGRRRAGGGKDRGPAVPTLKQWLTGDGAQFKTPKRSRNWLGGDVVRVLAALLRTMCWLTRDM
jgi:hypothetical protein